MDGSNPRPCLVLTLCAQNQVYLSQAHGLSIPENWSRTRSQTHVHIGYIQTDEQLSFIIPYVGEKIEVRNQTKSAAKHIYKIRFHVQSIVI